MDEVIGSLEALQKELTGFYSKRQFAMLNHMQLKRRTDQTPYCIVVFSINRLDTIAQFVGHDAAQETLSHMRQFIDKHFGDIGGFSARRNTGEIVTMLPYSNLSETEGILNNFAEDFRKQIIPAMQADVCAPAWSGAVHATITAGIAEGHPSMDVDTVVARAVLQQKEIGRLNCAPGV